jgi:hypothetical protein
MLRKPRWRCLLKSWLSDRTHRTAFGHCAASRLRAVFLAASGLAAVILVYRSNSFSSRSVSFLKRRPM